MSEYEEAIMPFDFAIYGPDDQLVAVFEAKSSLGTDASWAARYRRNLLQYLGPFPAKYFGMVTPEHLYLWRNSPEDTGEAAPHVVHDIRGELAEVMGRKIVEPLTGPAFELLVSSWLHRMTLPQPSNNDSLSAIGLRRGIEGGRIALEAAA